MNHPDAPTVQVSATAFAIARLAERDETRNLSRFIEAYSVIPAMLRTIADEKVGNVNQVHHWSILEAMLEHGTIPIKANGASFLRALYG